MGAERALARYAGERVVVFGATGFIGAWVARVLARHGARVTLAVRDPATGQALRSELGEPAELARFDAFDPAGVDALLGRVRPAVTFNLVGYGVDRGERDETLAHRLNAEFPVRLCEALARTRATAWPGAALVHAGTQLEYGNVRVIAEDATPAPTTVYGRTKLEGTLGLARCAGERQLPCVTARLFTVYGPGEAAGRLLPSLIERARTGAALDLTAGTQAMDFVYVEDVAEGLARLGLADVSPGEIVNLTTGALCTVRAFAETAAHRLGMPAGRLRFGALPQRAETMQYEPVIPRRLRELTGWTPPTDVAAGIERTVQSTD